MLKICRICLATDVELQRLEEPLSSMHDELCDYDVEDYALCCPKCIYLLRKFHNFKNKCKRACAILKNWERQSKITRLPLNKLQTKLPDSLGFSSDNNRAIYSYDSQIENEEDSYLQKIHSLLSKNDESYIILDITGPQFKDKKVTQKNKVDDELESIVKIEEFDDSVDYLDDIIDDVDDRLDNDEPVLKENLNDQDIINNEVIKNCGQIAETLDSDSSDDEVPQKKRKSKYLEEELGIDIESKSKRLKYGPESKEDLEETQRYVKRRLGDRQVKDKKGNVIDVDSILNNLDKMHQNTYNRIKRFCAGNDPLSTEAIEFLARIQKRYGNQYSSVFITKHLTTEEEIIKELRNKECNENYVQSEYKCTRCFRYFKFPKQLDYHIAEFHNNPNKIHKCQYCDLGFNRVNRLQMHLLRHRVVYQCKLCPLVTNYTDVMESHFNMHKGVRYPCVKCDAVFKSPPVLASHMNSVHHNDHICPFCSRNFHSEFGLHLHMRKKHPNDVNTGPPSAKCDQCNIQFVNDEVYQNHMRKSHSDPKNIVAGVDMLKKKKRCTNRRTPRYTCRACGGVESSMGALIWHFKTEHPHETFEIKDIALRATYKYLCHECGKGFKDITTFTDHKNVHTGARPYKCPKCPKAFYHRAHLRNHIEFHLPPSKECKQCGKKFHSASNLYNHMRQHTGNRRHACKLCGKTFLHQASVTEHVKGVHQNIKRIRVIEGFEALDDLEKIAVNPKTFRPVKDAKITTVTIQQTL